MSNTTNTVKATNTKKTPTKRTAKAVACTALVVAGALTTTDLVVLPNTVRAAWVQGKVAALQAQLASVKGAAKTPNNNAVSTPPKAGNICDRIWVQASVLHAQGAATIAAMQSWGAEQGINKATVQTQFYRWRKHNNIA